ncbi:helix-turn-helix transcriptional regulator [Candidatus Dojkabacteria bacterium]|uniref:Helix-turn-helix transcriptional regulator n=1 Tax=Candidatus Dojkabacteria bacterium TaxID=2099670 RepID=A0A955L9H2_9BACT|nr:helix-turn-helix transcriptional regulator [Candidatus Dojkabacteria bacterium]
MNNIGSKIKFFRSRANHSQFQLETEIKASPGSISRIESGQVNPTKETILQIANTLKLNSQEINYLIGITAQPATALEIEEAKKEAYDELIKPGKLAYLLDDRWRFIESSDAFIEYFNFTPQEVDYIMGKTTVQVILRQDSPMLTRLDKNTYGDDYEDLYRAYLRVYFSNISYMNDDIVFQSTLKDIRENDLTKRIWDSLTYEKDMAYESQDKRLLHFNINGKRSTLSYSDQALLKNSRFVIVDYREYK